MLRACVRLSASPVCAVRENHRLDVSALHAHLVSTGVLAQEEAQHASLEQFSHGQSNPTYLLHTPLQRLVLRKQPPGALLRGAHAVDREHRVMQALAATQVPVPVVRAFCADPSVIGTPFFCYSFVGGRFLKDPALPGTPVEERAAVYAAMLSTLASLHSVDVNAAGLADFGVSRASGGASFTPYVLRQVKTWSKQYLATETESIPLMDRLMRELPECLPPSAERASCLVHGDFRIDNMIFRADRNEVAAVLDWELATLGDPLADLAYHLMPFHMPDNAFMKGIRDAAPAGVPSASACFEEYCRRVAAPPSAADLDYYLAFSFFRVCAILQGVYRRSLQGNASSASAPAAIGLARETASIGAALLGRYKAGLSVGRRQYSTSVPASFAGLVGRRAKDLLSASEEFLRTRLRPCEDEILTHMLSSADRWTVVHPRLEQLKAEARGLGLWNMFLPLDTDSRGLGAGLTNLEYASIAELTGYASPLAPELFNCSAPDTGNMEVLARFGSEEQQRRWLAPLLAGSVRSCFAMTEPEVASSDATNMRATIERRGDSLVLNGHKWWISGASDPRCKVCIFMGRAHGDASTLPAHGRHSMVLVPMDTPGVRVARPMTVMGYDDAPHGHAEVFFDGVVVPASSFVLGEGRGFEVAQGRLGPGRIHHCMRLIGMAERALELMCERVATRVAFGKPLAEQGTIRQDIALSRVEISQARLLCLHAAHVMDVHGNKAARGDIAAIKVVAPRMAKRVIDRSIQAHGGMGLSQDSPLASMWTWARVLQLADGPDEVHLESIAKSELKRV